MLIRRFFPQVYFNLEAEGAGGASGAGGAGDAGKAAPAAGADAGGKARGADAVAAAATAALNTTTTTPATEGVGAGAPAAYWPDGFGEAVASLKGQTDRETIDNLTKRVASIEGPPKSSADYKLTLEPTFTSRFGDLNDDPILPIWREVAHKHGLSDKQFNGAITEFYAQLADKGFIEEAFDPYAELEKLGGKSGDAQARRSAGAQRQTAVLASIQGLSNRGVFDKVEQNLITAMTARAEGTALVEKILKQFGEHGLQGGGSGVPAASKEDLKAMLKDPRYDSNSPTYDPAFRRQVDERGRALSGGR